jgi:formylglycine-generating enzyme required for sulfatase activity
MKLVLVPPGEFMMGSPESDEDASVREQPQHKVRITQPFYLGVTEVTQGQWESVMETRPWEGEKYVKEGTDYAATWVSWEDAQEFCRKLSETEGVAYRLPTEAEWEYACRAGTTTVYHFGNDESDLGDYGWFEDNAADVGEEYAHQVGLKKPNAFGLYDMHGNVWEWCQDWYAEDYYANSPTDDPQGPSEEGSYRVDRGGSWYGAARLCRSANRSWYDPSDRYGSLGFRVARSPSGK